MLREGVPRQSRAVVKPRRAEVAQEVHQRPRQQGILQRDGAVVAGTYDMDRTSITPQLFTDGAVIDESGDQDAVCRRGAS